ncbi:helix-turn-helix domain-containing protein [Streptomyces lydicus]|uniref:helix-turn-helix domain-containing protein n=1 Tax=Streptomyces lydicus TaxID=47763 RepID=UPI003789BEE0
MSPQISTNVRKLRRAAGLTQEELSDASGVSVTTISNIEQGGSARMASFARLAQALDVDTEALFTTGAPQPAPDDRANAQYLMELRRQLMPPVGLTDAPAAPVAVASRAALEGDIDTAHTHYQADDYAEVARRLPGILAGAEAALAAAEGEDARRAMLGTRARAQLLTGKWLTQVRQYDLAYQALSSGIRDARTADHQTTAAVGVVGMCWLLLRQDRFTEAQDLAVSTADAVEPRMSTATPGQLAVWGELALRIASAAVRKGQERHKSDIAAARRMAASAASALGREHLDFRAHWSTFGPATAEIKALEDLSLKKDARGVLRGADQGAISPSALERLGRPSPNNWSRHRLDVARAHVLLGAHQDAMDELMGLYREAPEWLKHQSIARDLMNDILKRRKRTLTKDMRLLASHLGIAG